jgi:hypothetical protein
MPILEYERHIQDISIFTSTLVPTEQHHILRIRDDFR